MTNNIRDTFPYQKTNLVSSQYLLVSNKTLRRNMFGFNFKYEYTGKISERKDKVSLKITIVEAMVKGYHECSFVVGVSEKG